MPAEAAYDSVKPMHGLSARRADINKFPAPEMRGSLSVARVDLATL